MDTRKTGTFICILRKQRGLTQSQLAERIGVTDKAVSRWETGKGFPDVSLLQPLAEALGTSVTELLAGEPLTEEEKAAHSDSALLEALRYAGGMGRRALCVLLAIAGVWLLALPLFLAANALPVRLGGLVLLLLAWLVGSGRLTWPKVFRFRSGVLTQRGAALVSALALAAALVLELLPWGAVLVFGRPAEDGTIGRFRETFSYFSLTPAGYANFFPLLTGWLTVALLLLSLLQWLRHRKKLGDAIFVVNIVALVFSLLPWVIFGWDFFSPIGGGITALLLISTLFLALANRTK